MLSLRKTFRFSNGVNGITAQPVTVGDLLGLVGTATSATGVTSNLAAVKIQRITIRTPSTSQSNNAPSLQWLGSFYSDPRIMNEGALGSAFPTVLSEAPPPASDAAMWIEKAQGSSTIIVSVTAPQGSVIDLDCIIKFANAANVTLQSPLTYVSSGLTTGYTYFGCLDKNTASPKIIPYGPISYYG